MWITIHSPILTLQGLEYGYENLNPIIWFWVSPPSTRFTERLNWQAGNGQGGGSVCPLVAAQASTEMEAAVQTPEGWRADEISTTDSSQCSHAGSFQALDWPKEGRGVLDLKTLSLLINIHFTKVTFIITLWDCYYDLNEQLSLRATIIECVCCSYWAHTSRACALQQEKPPQWKPCAPKWRVVPTHCN